MEAACGPEEDDPVEDDDADTDEIDRHFPGSEEYDEALQEPKFDGIDDRDDPEARKLRRERFLIQAARGRAQQIYEKTGKCPALNNDPDYAEFLRNGITGATAADDGPDGSPPHAADGPAANGNSHSAPSREHPKHELDAYGKDIWVEKVDERGKRVVWIKLDSNGRRKRYRRDGAGTVFIEPA